MNPLALILILGTAGAFAIKAITTLSGGNKSSVKIMNIDRFRSIGSEFEISLTIAVDNPTTHIIKLKQPYLRIFYNNNEIANSIPSDSIIIIKANARTIIKEVNVRIPYSNAPMLVAELFGGKLSTQTIAIQVETTANGFPVKDKKEYKIADILKLFKI